MLDPSPVEVPSTKATCLRGRKLVFPSPGVADKVKATRPLTRAATKHEIHVKEDTIGVSNQRIGKSIVVENPVEIIVTLTSPLLKKRAIILLRGPKDNLKRQGLRLMK
jgi:hypothetical protein